MRNIPVSAGWRIWRRPATSPSPPAMMNESRGAIQKTTQVHPRRPPAHKSVSLRHSPPPAASKHQSREHYTARSSPTLASDRANPPSSASPQLLSNKNSSGESSDAGQWFEKTNNKASQSKSSFVDNEPPFFLRNSSSSETPPDHSHYAHIHPSIPYRSSLGQLGTDGSSTEDFRSVIDDLTVANKRLKQKLKKYERLYDAHLQGEKLFEVRFHGLPDHKKKELEETLRKFASDLDDGTAKDYAQISGYAPALETHNTASSISRFAESGYASVSASGQNSSLPSNQDKDRRKMTRSAYSRQQQSIQSYLHNIPLGLVPNNKSASMTDKSKKKMVVRRLEQIFAGKRSAPGSHPHPMQQQEVSQSAATADREQREATGLLYKPEGQREARIMYDHGTTEEDETCQEGAIQGLRPTLQIEEHDFAGSDSSPDQRPTRPLDLDPYRAQVPLENMNYIRHLGFTPPDMHSGEAPLGHGWIYLNLLINMAQLHTLNVTPEFVKDALHEYSSHLEISRDGRKIRWKGGRDVTAHSGESSSEHYDGASPNENGSLSPFKRTKTGDSGAGSALVGDSEHVRKLASAQREKEQNKFAYKPLFFHKEDSDNEEDYYGFDAESSASYSHHLQPAGNSSGFSSSVMQSQPFKPRRDDGPMIFYNKAKFCTDLSGDRHGAFLTMPGAYKAITSQPLGVKSDPALQANAISDIAEPRGPFDSTPMDIDSMSGGRTVSSSEDLGFSPEALKDDSGNTSPELVNFEASGLGGVQPEDNFSIHVRRAQVSTAPTHISTRRRSSLYPKTIQDALDSQQEAPEATSPRSSPQPVIQQKILSANHKSLPNSVLPPASYLPFDSCSSGDVDSDLASDASDASSEPDDDSSESPATAMQILNIAPGGSEDSEESESDYEESDDGSVDLLATARQQDPTAVHASEREYDAALADRLAEEIVAGSSAATAGGGSGFNSPVGGLLLETKLEKMQSRDSRSSSMISAQSRLKRTRTSDSKTNMQPKKSLKTRRAE
ncbi:frequency clock [Pyrenophora seminiperda CCB06]|uniref:Frequency clock n=1 Tax=Pyrenophora seminiperda CCB06 TaxID=1302712 RepID=A0A3M7MCI1_9PLEO|nr:frequency clock [Pyrenophora seminiperda CCB06]